MNSTKQSKKEVDPTCPDCGRIVTKLYGGLCQSCYNYYRLGGKVHELPPVGEVVKFRGKPVCHICGKAYSKLMAHVQQIHGMNEIDYKLEYGLSSTKGITSKAYAKKMRKNARMNRKIILENLNKGKEYQFKKDGE